MSLNATRRDSNSSTVRLVLKPNENDGDEGKELTFAAELRFVHCRR